MDTHEARPPYPSLDCVDRAVSEIDRALRAIAGVHRATRPTPAENIAEAELSEAQRAHAAALMRVNHVGEVCAQALYQGQALTARDAGNRAALEEAAREEEDHLAWSADRVHALGGRLSLLNPLWYAGALAMGVGAGVLGDRWNLAVLAETEAHLESLPEADARSRAIVAQMRADEAKHRRSALALGAAEVPAPLKRAMRAAARVMTTLAHRI
jgi:ubiquinone biosynthesis monooxygenase Coq7